MRGVWSCILELVLLRFVCDVFWRHFGTFGVGAAAEAIEPFGSDFGNPFGKRNWLLQTRALLGLLSPCIDAVFTRFRKGCRFIGAFLRHCVGISQLLVLLLKSLMLLL